MKSIRSGTGARHAAHALTAALAMTVIAGAGAQAPLPVLEAPAPPVFIDPAFADPVATPVGAPVPIGTAGPGVSPPVPIGTAAPIGTTMPVPIGAAELPPAPFALPPPLAPGHIGVAGASGTSMRDVFMGTLAVAAQTTGTTLIMGVTQAVTSGLTDWFNRKASARAAQQQATAASAAAAGTISAGGPAMPPMPLPAANAAAMPIYTADAGGGTPGLISQGATAPQPIAPPVPFFDPQTGFATSAEPTVLAATNPVASSAGDLFAGLAYEVHMVGLGGATMPVNPATHEFHTGERFIVLYRPTLPGRMDVYNINPAGRQTQIDRTEIAGGQLARLGPYEFSAMTGNEQLKLVLSPCSTPALTVATRDIVNVSAAPTGSGFDLADCATLVTRSAGTVATRDIRKVAVEGTTGFALDPVSAPERESGRLAPRELTISFRHR